MKIAETKHIKHLKQCAFSGCTNRFYGTTNRKYCRDQRCIARRKEEAANKPRKIVKDPDADNIILEKRVASKIKKGKVLTIRCRARNGNGHRCKKTFTTIYEPQCSVYPKYCSEHRSHYRRKRFSLVKKEKHG